MAKFGQKLPESRVDGAFVGVQMLVAVDALGIENVSRDSKQFR
jgi:hypothetical protein